MSYAWLFWKDCLALKNILKFINKNLITIELVVIVITIALSTVLQYFVYSYDLTKCLNNDFILDFYKTVVCSQSSDFIKIVDGFALIVGGVSFFVKKWAEKDSQNIVYILILVFSLVISHILKLINIHVVSFFIAVAVVLLIFIPFIEIIYDCIVNSKQFNLRFNTPKF